MKLNRKIHIAGMLVGALLLVSAYLGLLFAMDHISLNVTRASDPASASFTNYIVFSTTAVGIIGFLLLALSVVSLVRGAHSRLQANHPGNP